MELQWVCRFVIGVSAAIGPLLVWLARPNLQPGRKAGGRVLEGLERRSLFAAHVVGDPTIYATIQAAVNAAAALTR